MSTVDDVKARLDIVDVVGGYVRLQKAGRYFKAPCPFHNEKTPSFYVNPDRQSWHCFGACGTGGDVISFVSKQREPRLHAARCACWPSAPASSCRATARGARRSRRLQDANEAAALFYHGLLQNAGPRQRLRQRSGASTSRRSATSSSATRRPAGTPCATTSPAAAYAEAQLVEAGLLIEGERGAYDRFRDRLMFPIRDDRGRVVGFGGRVLPGGRDGVAARRQVHQHAPDADLR